MKKKKLTASQIEKQLDKLELDKKRKIIDDKEKFIEDNRNHLASEQQALKSESLLIEDFETQLSSNEPIRELLNAKNIKFKTELTEEQRGAISILYHAYKTCVKYGIDFYALKNVLDEYIDFGVSIDRKGRTEYVEAHRSNLQNQFNQQQGMGQNGVPQQMNNMKM